jgi:hypothetical protein
MIFVIPGDAKMRIQNKNMKSQATAFAVFSCFILLSYSLFQQGFWSTYNQSFSRIKHVHSEVQRSENLILCESDLGKGYVIESSNSKLVLYSDSLEDFITIKETDNYKFTTPIQTNKKLRIKEHLIIDISTDSLNQFLSSKLIKEMKLTSKYKLSFFLHHHQEKKTIQEQYCKDLVFTEQEDTTKSVLLEQLKLKTIKLQEIQAKNEQIEQEYLSKKKQYKLLKAQYTSATLEEKEHIYKKLQKAKGVAEQDKGKIFTTAVLQEEIRYLKEQLTHTNKNQVTGIVKEITIDDIDGIVK